MMAAMQARTPVKIKKQLIIDLLSPGGTGTRAKSPNLSFHGYFASAISNLHLAGKFLLKGLFKPISDELDVRQGRKKAANLAK
jgi:hypothetical protein